MKMMMVKMKMMKKRKMMMTMKMKMKRTLEEDNQKRYYLRQRKATVYYQAPLESKTCLLMFFPGEYIVRSFYLYCLSIVILIFKLSFYLNTHGCCFS